MKLLCTKNKCILLPVCVSKEDIECEQLYSYIYRETQRKMRGYPHSNIKYARFWKQTISDTLPHLKRVRNGYMFYQIPHNLNA